MAAEVLFTEWDIKKDTVVSVDDQVHTELAVKEIALDVLESGKRGVLCGLARGLLGSVPYEDTGFEASGSAGVRALSIRTLA
jgi:hypothetical protein